MESTWSLDDVARTTDDAAVRRRFDQRNLRWALGAAIFFGFISAVLQFEDRNRQSMLDVALANASLLFAALSLLLMAHARRTRRASAQVSRVGRWINDHASAFALTYFAVQYLLLLGLTFRGNNWIGWVMSFPLFVLPLRMRTAELGLMHVLFVAGALAMTQVTTTVSAKELSGILAGAATINALTLGTEIFLSHRMRKKVTFDWSERRTQAREQIRMRDELRYARELQLSMLPAAPPRLDWLDVSGISIPATEVGGDYFDYFVNDHRVALVCGDVAGHGMASGLVLAAIRSGFTLLRDSLDDPAAVLRRLHDLVAETSGRRMLVTVSVVLLDREGRQATIASAGHPPVIFRRASGEVETIDLYAPPLGVRLPVVIPQRRIDVGPGDAFVLHSDGIYETRRAGDEVYGLGRLTDVIERNGTQDAESLRNAILADVDRFRGRAEPEDDVTVVACRLR